MTMNNRKVEEYNEGLLGHDYRTYVGGTVHFTDHFGRVALKR